VYEGAVKTYETLELPDDVKTVVEAHIAEKLGGFAALQAEHERLKEAQTRSLEEIDALSKKTSLTERERNDMDERLKTMRAQVQSDKTISEQERVKLTKKHQKELEGIAAEKQQWQSRYTELVVDNSLQSAAIEHKAYNPKQLISILRPQTELVEELDEDNKPTGRLQTRVNMDVPDEKDKTKMIKVKLSPSEAVKRMSADDSYMNLFNVEGTNGMGRRRAGGGGGVNSLADVASDPVAYRKARAEGKTL
jgi:vacuolar-type H+-ATPase subunit I/STV1